MLLTCMKEEEEECDVVIGRSMRAENDVFCGPFRSRIRNIFWGNIFSTSRCRKKLKLACGVGMCGRWWRRRRRRRSNDWPETIVGRAQSTKKLNHDLVSQHLQTKKWIGHSFWTLCHPQTPNMKCGHVRKLPTYLPRSIVSTHLPPVK